MCLVPFMWKQWLHNYNFLSWCMHLLVPFLFHALTSLHPPSFHRNDFSTCSYSDDGPDITRTVKDLNKKANSVLCIFQSADPWLRHFSSKRTPFSLWFSTLVAFLKITDCSANCHKQNFEKSMELTMSFTFIFCSLHSKGSSYIFLI